MKKISAISLIMIMASCGGNGNHAGPGSSQFITQNYKGFTAQVGDDYSAEDMKAEFGGYCETKGKQTRSLIKKKSENGGNIVVGSCL